MGWSIYFDLVFVVEHLSQNAAAPSQLALIKSIPSTTKEVIAAQRALTELEAIPNKTPGYSTRHRTPPVLPIQSRTRTGQRDQTPAQLPQPVQSRHVDTVSAIGRVYSHCQNLRCDRQFGTDNRGGTQNGGVLPDP